MGYRIVFAPQAHTRLEEIVRFIAQDDPQAAIRFGDYLVDRAESLAQFPELGTPYRKRQSVRRLLFLDIARQKSIPFQSRSATTPVSNNCSR